MVQRLHRLAQIQVHTVAIQVQASWSPWTDSHQHRAVAFACHRREALATSSPMAPKPVGLRARLVESSDSEVEAEAEWDLVSPARDMRKALMGWRRMTLRLVFLVETAIRERVGRHWFRGGQLAQSETVAAVPAVPAVRVPRRPRLAQYPSNRAMCYHLKLGLWRCPACGSTWERVPDPMSPTAGTALTAAQNSTALMPIGLGHAQDPPAPIEVDRSSGAEDGR